MTRGGSTAKKPISLRGQSTYDLNHSMRDIDRRMAEVETYVTAQNRPLAREIESLR